MRHVLSLSLFGLFVASPAFAGVQQQKQQQRSVLRGAQLRKAVSVAGKQEFGWAANPGERLHFKVLAPAKGYHGPIRNVLVSTANIKSVDVHQYNMGNRFSTFTPLKLKPGQKAPATKVFGGAQIDLRTGKMSGGGVG
jgi:hypothetical protein